MSEQAITKRGYVLNALALFVLLVLTIGAAQLPTGPLGPVVALLIAGSKAVLVALFFMHLTRTRSITRLFAAAGLFWLVILIALTLADAATRGWSAPTG